MIKPIDLIGFKHKYRSRKKVNGKWVYDYGEGGKQSRRELVTLSPEKEKRRKEIQKEFVKLTKEKDKAWDKYFGEHPLTEKYYPNAKRGTNDPKDKEKLIKIVRKIDKLNKEWDEGGYGKLKK